MLRRPIFAYDSAARRFALAAGAQRVRIWALDQAGTQKTEATANLDTAESAIVGLAWDEGQLITVHETGQVFGWDWAEIVEGQPRQKWRFDAAMAVGEVASWGGPGRGALVIALGGASGDIVVVRPGGREDFSAARSTSAHADRVEVLTFSDDGKRLATSGRDREIALWSTQFRPAQQEGQFASLEEVRRLTGSGGWPLALSFSSDRRRLVSGCMDNGVYLWDLEAESTLEQVCFEHHGWVETVAWLPGDRAVVTGSWDNSAIFFDGPSMDPKYQFLYHGDYVSRVLPVEGTTRIFVASYDGEVSVWDGQSGQLETVLQGHTDWVTELADVGDGLVASLSSDQTVRLWSTKDLSSKGVLGTPEMMGFDLSGSFDLPGTSRQSSEGNAAAKGSREGAHKAVVRRFDASQRLGSQPRGTAISMLESALEKAEKVDADTVDVEPPQEAAHAPSSVGEELSGLVLDAISDVEDEGPRQLGAGLSGESEESDPMSLFDAPADEEPPGGEAAESEPVDIMDPFFDPGEEVDESDDDPGSSGPLPTSGKFYDPRPLGPDDDILDALPDDQELDSLFSNAASEVSEVDETTFNPPADDEPEADEPADDEPEAHEPIAEEVAAEATPEDVPQRKAPGLKIPKKQKPPQLKPDQTSSPWMRGRAPTTLTRAKPLSALDDVDDESATLPQPRFPKVADSTAKPKERSTAPGSPLRDLRDGQDAESPEAVGNKTMSPFRSVDTDEDSSSGSNEKSLKVPAPSDKRGEKWRPKSLNLSKLRKLARNLNRDADSSSGPGDSEESQSESTATIPLEPAPEKKEASVEEKASVEESEEAIVDTSTQIMDAPTQMVEPLVQIEESPTQVMDASQFRSPILSDGADDGGGADAEEEEELVDENLGNRTLIGGMRPYSPEEDDPIEQGAAGPEVEAQKRPRKKRQIEDFSRRNRALKSGARGTRKSPAESPGLEEETVHARGAVPLPTGLEGAAPDQSKPPQRAKRKAPKLQRSQPEKKKSDGPGATVEFVDLELAKFWELLGGRAPQMGILKRRRRLSTEYEPSHQIATKNNHQMSLDLSSRGKRLVTAGEKGGVQLWSGDGRLLVTLGGGHQKWLDAGFVEGRRLLYGLEKSGRIHLWLLPKAKIEKSLEVNRTIIDIAGATVRCGCVDGEQRLALLGFDDGSAQVWSIEKGRAVVRTESQKVAVVAVAFGQRGPISVGEDGAIRFWNEKGLLVDQVGSTGAVRALAASDGTLVWVEESGAVQSMPEGASRPEKLMGHYGEGRDVVFRSDGCFITGGEDGRLLVYDRSDEGGNNEPASEIQIPAPVQKIALGGKCLAVSCAGGKVFLFGRSKKQNH